ncbi:3233_t:CDS:1, partial [Dentiscutata erythropus]
THLIQIKAYIELLIIHLTTYKNYNECKDRKYLHEINLAEQEWDLLKNFIQVLGPFAEATQYLGDLYYLTHSLMHHVIEKLKEMFEPTIIEMDELNDENEEDAFDYEEEEQTVQGQIKLKNPINTMDLLNEVKIKIYTTLCHYYPNLTSQELVSVLLDPQLKSLDFVNITNRLAAKDLLKNLYDNEKLLDGYEVLQYV